MDDVLGLLLLLGLGITMAMLEWSERSHRSRRRK